MLWFVLYMENAKQRIVTWQVVFDWLNTVHIVGIELESISCVLLHWCCSYCYVTLGICFTCSTCNTHVSSNYTETTLLLLLETIKE